MGSETAQQPANGSLLPMTCRVQTRISKPSRSRSPTAIHDGPGLGLMAQPASACITQPPRALLFHTRLRASTPHSSPRSTTQPDICEALRGLGLTSHSSAGSRKQPGEEIRSCPSGITSRHAPKKGLEEGPGRVLRCLALCESDSHSPVHPLSSF